MAASAISETILPGREESGFRRWGLSALFVFLVHVCLLIGFMLARESEMPPGNPPDTVMINLAPIPVAPPPQEEVNTPPQPQEVEPAPPPQSMPPQPSQSQQPTTAIQAPIMPDVTPNPRPETMSAPPQLRALVPAPIMPDLQQAPNPEVVMAPPPPPTQTLRAPQQPAAQSATAPTPPEVEPLPEQQVTAPRVPAPPKVEKKQAEKTPAKPETRQRRSPERAHPRTNLPRAATAAAPAAGFNGAAVASWKSEIVMRISSVKEYPEEGRAQGVNGTAIVAFSVDRGGRVFGIRLARSSGSSVLDRAAVVTVFRANPVPSPPPGVPGGHFTIPLHFYVQ